MNPDKSTLLPVADALAIVRREAKTLAPLPLPPTPALIGTVLAEAVESDIDSPPYTKALMDGYAVQSSAAPSSVLRIVEEIAAGKVPSKRVGPGEAARIMTGAPIPEGADAVIPIEKTESPAAGEVRVLIAPRSGLNILPRGAEMKAGETILRSGTLLGPQEFGILASVGRTTASVYARPKVAVISTGDEIVEPSRLPGPGQIRNSNSPMLAAQIQRAGGIGEVLGIARDNLESLRSLIGTGLGEFDVLILSGGVSAGKFDLVPGVLQELGVAAHFHKIALKPGKPLFFGTLGSKLVFGLPGNPVSSFVCFELFIRPALKSLMGMSDSRPRTTRLLLGVDFRADNDRPTYWPARVEFGDGTAQPSVQPLAWTGSADLRSIHGADALLVIPPGQITWTADMLVPVILLHA